MNKNIITGLKIIGIVALLTYLYFFVKVYTDHSATEETSSTIERIWVSMISALLGILWNIVTGVTCLFDTECKLFSKESHMVY